MCDNNLSLPRISEDVLELQMLAAFESCSCECCAPPVCQLMSYHDPLP